MNEKNSWTDGDGDQGWDEGTEECPTMGRLEKKPKNPIPLQPIGWDGKGVIRFRPNKIVRWLLDAGPFDLNQFASLPGITNAERMQFAMLIGYSVSGAGDLSFFDMETTSEMDFWAGKVLDDKKKKNSK